MRCSFIIVHVRIQWNSRSPFFSDNIFYLLVNLQFLFRVDMFCSLDSKKEKLFSKQKTRQRLLVFGLNRFLLASSSSRAVPAPSNKQSQTASMFTFRSDKNSSLIILVHRNMKFVFWVFWLISLPTHKR